MSVYSYARVDRLEYCCRCKNLRYINIIGEVTRDTAAIVCEGDESHVRKVTYPTERSTCDSFVRREE